MTLIITALIPAVQSQGAGIAAPESRAMTAFNRGDYPSARALFSSEVGARPGDLALRISYAITLLQLQDYNAALEQLDRAALIAPDAAIIGHFRSVVERGKKTAALANGIQFGLTGDGSLSRAERRSRPPVTPQGGPDMSVDVLEKAAEQNPNCAPVANLLADAYQLMGSRQKAEEWYRKAAGLAPKWNKPLIGLALLTLDTDATKSANLLEEALKRDPTNSRAKLWLGDAYQKLGRIDEARKLYEQCAASPDTMADARVRLGVSFMRSKQMDQALRLFAGANRAEPTNAAALAGQAQVYAFEKRSEEAQVFISEAQTVTKHSSKDTQAAVFYNRALVSDSVEGAVENYARATAAAPDLQPAFSRVAGLYKKQGVLNQKIADYSSKLKGTQEDIPALRFLVEGYGLTGRYDLQLATLNRLVKVNAQDLWLWRTRQAEVLWTQKRQGDAVRHWLQAAVAGYPVRMRSVAASINARPPAADLVRESMLGSKAAETRRAYAHLRFALDWAAADYHSALTAIDEVIALDPNNPALYGHKASILKQLGRIGDAEQALRKQRELIPLTPPFTTRP